MIREDAKRVIGGWVSLSSTAGLKVCIYRYLRVCARACVCTCVHTCTWAAPVMAPSWVCPHSSLTSARIRWILREYVCNEALACERQNATSSTGETFDLSSVPCWRRGRGGAGWKKEGGAEGYAGVSPLKSHQESEKNRSEWFPLYILVARKIIFRSKNKQTKKTTLDCHL